MWLGGDRLDADRLLLESGRAATRVGLRPPQVVEDHPLVGDEEAPSAIGRDDLAPVDAGDALGGVDGAHLLGGIPPQNDALVGGQFGNVAIVFDVGVGETGEGLDVKDAGEEVDHLRPTILEHRAGELALLVDPDRDVVGPLGCDPEDPVLRDQSDLPVFNGTGTGAPQQPDMVVRVLRMRDSGDLRLLDVDCRPAKDDALHLRVVPSADDVLLAVHADRPNGGVGGEGDLEQGGSPRFKIADFSASLDLLLLSAEVEDELDA